MISIGDEVTGTVNSAMGCCLHSELKHSKPYLEVNEKM